MFYILGGEYFNEEGAILSRSKKNRNRNFGYIVSVCEANNLRYFCRRYIIRGSQAGQDLYLG